MATHITLVAEEQFLYATENEISSAIARKTKQFFDQGITFIDARTTKIDYALLAKRPGRYMVYKPDIQGGAITAEYQKIQAVTNDNAIVVAAKFVPSDAQFKIFVREGAGTNNIPKKQAAAAGNIVINCPGVNSAVTARNTLNAIAGHPHIERYSEMAFLEKASALNLKSLYGASPAVDRKALHEKLDGKMVAVLGAGDIGTQTILALLDSPTAKVKVYSRSLAKYSLAEIEWLKMEFPKLEVCASVNQAVDGAHILVNHLALVPGVSGTENIVGDKQLAKMADDAEIIDAARPGIINPEALINARNVKRIVVDFDTPDKAPDDSAIRVLFTYAQSRPAQRSFLYSPHAFADTCPETREMMLDEAVLRIAEVGKGGVCNFAGEGEIPAGYAVLPAKKPDGISHLEEILDARLAKKEATHADSD